jgi:hypothetical protein
MNRDSMNMRDEVAVSLGRGARVDDETPIRGRLTIEVRDAAGRVKERVETTNLVVTTGKNHVADQLASTPAQGAMSHMALGTGSTAPAAGDTTLGTEIDRNALTSRTSSGNVVTYVGNWAAGDATNAAITEAGIFNAASSGTMLVRATFTAINKGASDTLQITWTLTTG